MKSIKQLSCSCLEFPTYFIYFTIVLLIIIRLGFPISIVILGSDTHQLFLLILMPEESSTM